jgi:hypothetical protein
MRGSTSRIEAMVVLLAESVRVYWGVRTSQYRRQAMQAASGGSYIMAVRVGILALM